MFSFEIDNIINTDLVIIGAGAAGIRACYEAVKNGVNDIVILSKGKILRSGSSFFPLVHGWGMQAVIPGLNPEDSEEEFYDEIIQRGQGMADERLVEVLVKEAYPRVKDLQELGLRFKERDGKLEQIVGCFSKKKRALSAINMDNIRKTFKRMIHGSRVKIFENFMVLDLIVLDEEFVGLIGINSDNRFIQINGRACIIASGGGSNVYKHSLNSGESTGDTYGLALRAGLTLYNMEFVQFIFGIIYPKRLIFSERALYYDPDILNRKNERFIDKYLPIGVDYSTVLRERILHGPFSSRTLSRHFDIAVFKEIRSGNGSDRMGVWVNLSDYWGMKDKGGEIAGKRWADVTDVWVEWLKDRHGIDVTTTLLEIDHAAHAFNGGVEADETTRSRVPNIFICGEALAGPHGADRLGGNMMTSTQVFGARAGYYAALEVKNHVKNRGRGVNFVKLVDIFPFPVNGNGEKNYSELRESIREKMWLYGHVVRDNKNLVRLKKELEQIKEAIAELGVESERDLKKKYELLNLLTVGFTITLASLKRKESRGSFYREDFPHLDPHFRRRIRISSVDGELRAEYMGNGKNL